MKFRLTLGNVIGIVTATAGFIVKHQEEIAAAAQTVANAPKTGMGIITAGVVILLGSKNIWTNHAHKLPEEKKVGSGLVIFEKTGLLKPKGL